MKRAPLLAALLAACAASAQPAVFSGAGDACTLYAVDGVARPGPALDDDAGAAARRAGLGSHVTVTRGRAATFMVRYTGFTPAAEAAFQRAVDIWADHLDSPAEVRVEASFEALGERVLGSAGPFLTRFLLQPGLPPTIQADTWYPFALADALASEDLFPNEAEDDPATSVDETFYYDIRARFNSEFQSWYFGLDAKTPPLRFDFVTVVLHELGHGLGFVGSAAYDDGDTGEDDTDSDECGGTDGLGCWGYFNGTFSGYPFIFDRFVEDARGRALLNTSVYPNPSAVLGALVQSEDLFIDAPTVTRINGAVRPEVWAPAAFELGSSFSHWDEVVFTRGTSSALMTPQLAQGESYRDPGTITCAFFQDMGWPLGAGCSVLFGTPAESGPLASADPALELAGPNPFRARTALRLTPADGRPVTVTLVDALGRTVRRLQSGPDGAVEVDGTGLAPGLYVVRVEGTSLSLPVIRAR